VAITRCTVKICSTELKFRKKEFWVSLPNIFYGGIEMDYLLIYGLVSDHILSISILFFITTIAVFLHTRDDSSDPVYPIMSAGILTMILIVCSGWCGGYAAEHTHEYSTGYEAFPDNTTYNGIIEIRGQQDDFISSKLDDRLFLYKLGWEDAKKEHDKQTMENTETALKNQIDNQTENLLQKMYNES
jgi:hypothetical protein